MTGAAVHQVGQIGRALQRRGVGSQGSVDQRVAASEDAFLARFAHTQERFGVSFGRALRGADTGQFHGFAGDFGKGHAGHFVDSGRFADHLFQFGLGLFGRVAVLAGGGHQRGAATEDHRVLRGGGEFVQGGFATRQPAGVDAADGLVVFLCGDHHLLGKGGGGQSAVDGFGYRFAVGGQAQEFRAGANVGRSRAFGGQGFLDGAVDVGRVGGLRSGRIGGGRAIRFGLTGDRFGDGDGCQALAGFGFQRLGVGRHVDAAAVTPGFDA